jgi:hypothetical protein
MRPRLVIAFNRLIFQCNPMQNVTRRPFEELESSASEIFRGFRRNQQGHWQQQPAKHEKSQCFWGPWSTLVPMVFRSKKKFSAGCGCFSIEKKTEN